MRLPRIRLLAVNVVSKIAAGEVIERPASVVKELLENSLDAGATSLTIELEQAGLERIRITDDGHGITPEDLPLAFTVHATSKLTTGDDLFRIATLGFRGEALASIGGVSQVCLESRASGEEVGAAIDCHGSVLSAVRPWNGAVGTRIDVRHLFFNTPVRRKFLRGAPTELGHIVEAVTRLALAHPQVAFTVRNNQRSVLDLPATPDLAERVRLFFGSDVRDALLPIDVAQGPLQLSGFVAEPTCDRGTNKLQYLFVNGRWIRDRSLGHAWQEAYRNLLMVGRYPVGFLFLTVPPDTVDVNVHPTKMEVRFRDAQVIYHLIRGAVRERLQHIQRLPSLEVPTFTPPPPPEPYRAPLFPVDSPRQAESMASVAPWEAPRVIRPPEVAPPVRTSRAAIQIHDAYLVVETSDGMLVMDQHALHERILFEQLQRRFRAGTLEVQRLLIPEPIEFPAVQAATLLEARAELLALGLEITEFGGNTILLASYPTLLAKTPPAELLKTVADHLVRDERAPSRDALLDHLTATMACKAAVKAGDKLSPEEISHLMELRDLAENSRHCPHGRPTTLTFSRHELDKQFKRIG